MRIQLIFGYMSTNTGFHITLRYNLIYRQRDMILISAAPRLKYHPENLDLSLFGSFKDTPRK